MSTNCADVWNRWQSQIPSTDIILAVIILCVCIIFPGLGTVIMLLVKNCNDAPDMLIVAILQFVSMIIIVGWIWSIYWGVLCVIKANGGNGSIVSNNGGNNVITDAQTPILTNDSNGPLLSDTIKADKIDNNNDVKVDSTSQEIKNEGAPNTEGEEKKSD